MVCMTFALLLDCTSLNGTESACYMHVLHVSAFLHASLMVFMVCIWAFMVCMCVMVCMMSAWLVALCIPGFHGVHVAFILRWYLGGLIVGCMATINWQEATAFACNASTGFVFIISLGPFTHAIMFSLACSFGCMFWPCSFRAMCSGILLKVWWASFLPSLTVSIP